MSQITRQDQLTFGDWYREAQIIFHRKLADKAIRRSVQRPGDYDSIARWARHRTAESNLIAQRKPLMDRVLYDIGFSAGNEV